MSVSAIAREGVSQRLRDYAALMKLRLTTLLLIIALASMLVAAHGHPQLLTVILVLVAGTLSAGACATFNEVLERDRDGLMRRTADRPIPSGRVGAREAVVFGLAQSVVSVGMAALWLNWLSALLILAAILQYVFVYTIWLKPSSPQGVVIGGAAGALPPLVGWAAVTGSLDATALGLFALVFFWTPPHFWALSLLLQEDYRRADYPMLPLLAGEAETRLQILLHSVLLVAVSLVVAVLGHFGAFYVAAAVALGAVWLALALRLQRGPSRSGARRLFLYSLMYLALIFAVMVVDQTLLFA